MGVRSGWPGLLGVVVLTLGMATAAVAEDRTTSRADGRLRKLGRGAANVLTSPAELLRTPELVGRKSGTLASLTVGLVQGAWRVIQRAAVGAFEVTTFFLEIPKDYAPIVQPEFVWAHGNWAE